MSPFRYLYDIIIIVVKFMNKNLELDESETFVDGSEIVAFLPE